MDSKKAIWQTQLNRLKRQRANKNMNKELSDNDFARETAISPRGLENNQSMGSGTSEGEEDEDSDEALEEEPSYPLDDNYDVSIFDNFSIACS